MALSRALRTTVLQRPLSDPDTSRGPVQEAHLGAGADPSSGGGSKFASILYPPFINVVPSPAPSCLLWHGRSV